MFNPIVAGIYLEQRASEQRRALERAFRRQERDRRSAEPRSWRLNRL